MVVRTQQSFDYSIDYSNRAKVNISGGSDIVLQEFLWWLDAVAEIVISVPLFGSLWRANAEERFSSWYSASLFILSQTLELDLRLSAEGLKRWLDD